jgi:HK97 family phage major capsid protein
MNSQVLNSRKNELLNAQEAMLNAAQESKSKLTAAQEETFANHTAEITSIDQTLTRMEAIAKGKREVGAPSTEVFVPKETKSGKKQFSAEYHEAFWARFKNRNFQNTTNLNEGSNANGDYLVPVTLDGTIVSLAPLESAMRKLALVIPTEMDIKLPAQLSKTTAVAKAESLTVTDASFGGAAPTFTQVTLGSHMAGSVVPVSFELAQDVPALQAFLNADILRGIQNYEEIKFINGNGTTEPQGILTGATAALTAALSASASLDFIGDLNSAYYDNASFLMNRKTGIAFRKTQLSANQFNAYWTVVGKQDYLHGFPVFYSTQMPVFAASPFVSGAIAFGDFKTAAVIGDRGGSAVSIKILDQINALNGVIQVLGYRRTDQRVRVAEAVQIWTVNG